MFLSGSTWYTEDGTQYHRGLFLIVIDREAELRAFVRTIEYRQMGHFMMGRLYLFGYTFVLSGSIGGDGLPCSLARCKFPGSNEFQDTPQPILDHIWENAVCIPKKLAEKYWKSTEHDASYLFKQWAFEKLPRLRKRFGRLCHV